MKTNNPNNDVIDLTADMGTTTGRIPLEHLQRYRKEVSILGSGRYVDMVADDDGAYVWDRDALAYVMVSEY